MNNQGFLEVGIAWGIRFFSFYGVIMDQIAELVEMENYMFSRRSWARYGRFWMIRNLD